MKGLTMTLGEKQELFMKLLPRLIDKALDLGFDVRGGDLYRDPRVHGDVGEKKSYSSATSRHKERCAIDLNLFMDGKFLQETKDHAVLGSWWEKQNPLCRWGGRFNDGNHYEIR